MAKVKTLNEYLLEKCLISFGLVNGIINAAIFFAMHADDQGAQFGREAVALDMALTGFLLGIILMYCAVFFTRKDYDKQVYQAKTEFNGLSRLLPNNKLLAALSIGLITAAVAVVFALAVTVFLPLPLNVVSMMALKGCGCAVGGAVAGFLTIIKTTHSRASFGATKAELHS